MKTIIALIFLMSSIANSETCNSAFQYLSKEAHRLDFKSVSLFCDYLDEVGLESEMDRAFYACRFLDANKCVEKKN